MVTIVLLNEAWMWAIPCGTCFRSFFLNVFFLPFLSGAAAPVPAAAGAAGFAISCSSRRSSVVGRQLNPRFKRQILLTTEDRRPLSKSWPPISSWLPLCPYAGLFGYARWCGCVVRGPAGSGDDDSRGRNQFR